MEDGNYSQLNGPSFFIGKQSEDIISLGSGQPDLPPPNEAFRGVCEQVLRKDLNMAPFTIKNHQKDYWRKK